MKNHYLALTGKLNRSRLNRVLIPLHLLVAVLCCVVAGVQYGPIGAAILLCTMPFVPVSGAILGANVLTNLIPDVYAALDVVSRELTGFITACQRDSRADRVAIGQSLRVPITPANVAGTDVTAAMSLPSRADQTIGNSPLTITKSRAFPFSWTGEEQMSVDAGPGYLTIQQDQVAQAIRAAVNEIETDLATEAGTYASRAYGTAGTTPFASDLSDTANIRKILDDNGAPQSDRSLIINTTAGAKVRTLTQLTKANEASDSSLLRQGTLLDVHGFAFRESAKVISPTKGTGASYLVNSAALAVGSTTIPADTGSGTILAGDVVTFAGDTNKYVVATALSAGSFTIAAPGLLTAVADNAAITVGNTAAHNVALTRNALLAGIRLPALPREGDIAIDRETVVDPRTGLVFEIAAYPGFRMVTYMVLVAWGQKMVKPEHSAILLG